MSERPESERPRELLEAEADADRARGELERALRFTESLLTAVPTPVFFKDAEGRYIGCNRAFTEVMGVTPEQIRGKTVHELWPSEHAEVYHRRDLELMAHPEHQVYEFKVRDRHGVDRPVIYAKSVFFDESDRAAGIVGAFVDISERVRAEQELRRRLAFEQVVLDISTHFVGRPREELEDGIAAALRALGELTDVDRVAIFVFRSASTVIDNTHEWCRAGIEPVVHKLHGVKVADVAFAQGMLLGQVVHVPDLFDIPAESLERAPLGREGFRSFLLVPMRCAGRVTGFLGLSTAVQERTWSADDIGLLRVAAETFANVLERRRVELRLQDSQRLEAIGRLAAGVAHDFNNMLTPILGYAELLANELPESEPPHAWVGQIAIAARRSRDLVRQLLAFSRKQLLELKPVDVGTIVTGLEPLLRRAIREDVELEIDVSPQPCRIRADVGQIEQIVMNLAVNAQDAMPGGGTLRIEAGPVDLDASSVPDDADVQPGPFARLAVSDTGCGMDERTRSHVFEPFFTTKRPGEGTGLGLSTVHGIVKQHGGAISLASEPGRGTRFEIYLPAVTAPPTPLPIGLEADQGAFEPGTTVMVVEDDEMVRDLVAALLARNGCTALSARSASEALELLERPDVRIDLLLTDLIMPGMNGRQLYAEVVRRVAGRQAGPIPRVLYMSGYTDSVAADLGVLEKDAGLIQKPFSLEALLAKVRAALGR